MNTNARRFWRMMPCAALVLAACGASSPAGAQNATPPKRQVKTIKINRVDRSYILRLPPAYDGKAKVPLVMLLNGANDSAAYAEVSYHFAEKADKEGFALLLPEALGEFHSWEGSLPKPNDDLTFLATLLEQLPKDYAIDVTRMYVSGHSAGAVMAYRVACERPDLVASVGVVAGAVGLDFPAPKTPVPVVAFHGRQDGVFPYLYMKEAMKFWAKVNHCPETPAKTEVVQPKVTRDTYSPAGPGGADMVAYTLDHGNHMWPGGKITPGKFEDPVQDISATDLMWDFFKAHRRN